jgi:hypothetical protein
MLAKTFWGVILAFAIGSAAHAECRIWARDDTSVVGQKRQQIFAYTTLTDRNMLVAQAMQLAERVSEPSRLDFVDVFLTRKQDGTNRSDHSTMSSLVHLRFNPGNTPIIKGLVEATMPQGDIAQLKSLYGMLVMGPDSPITRDELSAVDIQNSVASRPQVEATRCR